MDNFPTLIKFFKNLCKKLSQDLVLYYEKLDAISNNNTDTLLQEKLNKEFYHELDSLLQYECNEEGKEHQQVNEDTISKLKKINCKIR